MSFEYKRKPSAAGRSPRLGQKPRQLGPGQTLWLFVGVRWENVFGIRIAIGQETFDFDEPLVNRVGLHVKFV
jgi:hypothetical protein